MDNQKNSILGLHEASEVPQIVKEFRKTMAIDKNGKLLEDANLGMRTPSFAGFFVFNQSNNGWVEWKTMSGNPIDIFRKKNQDE